jgi:cysteine desulfurase
LLEQLKLRKVPFVLNGHPTCSLPHILNLSFVTKKNHLLVQKLDLAGIACSSGASCLSGSLKPSHVLQAMGLSQELIDSAVRFSFGLENTQEEIEQVADVLAKWVGTQG